MAINNTLKDIREERNLIQADLAEAIGSCSQTIGPVSYTHLDVYKRQHVCCAHVTQSQYSIMLIVNAPAAFYSLKSVSYTHLTD